jgi:hypothetical protein
MLKGRAFIATPTYRGEVVSQYVKSLFRDFIECANHGWFLEQPWFLTDTLIHFARHHAMSAFLATECEHLVFIDADMGWEKGGLIKLLETPGDIVGGLYPSKSKEIHYPFQGKLNGEAICEVDGVPTGFMKISRRAVHRVLADFAKPFAPMYDEHGREWGEDLAFCNRAKSCGLSVIARTDIRFEHVGPYVWTGCAIEDIGAKDDKGNEQG